MCYLCYSCRIGPGELHSNTYRTLQGLNKLKNCGRLNFNRQRSVNGKMYFLFVSKIWDLCIFCSEIILNSCKNLGCKTGPARNGGSLNHHKSQFTTESKLPFSLFTPPGPFLNNANLSHGQQQI